MTAPVAAAAARSAAGSGAASAAGGQAAKSAATSSAGKSAGTKAASSKGYMDAVGAGTEKKPKADSGGSSGGGGGPKAFDGTSVLARATRPVTKTHHGRLLVAEFLLCIVILALSPLARPKDEVKPRDWMKRGSAMCGVFMLLGLLSGAGQKAGKVAVAIGGLITVVLVVDQREIFGVLTKRLKQTEGESAGGGGDQGAGEGVPDGGGSGGSTASLIDRVTGRLQQGNATLRDSAVGEVITDIGRSVGPGLGINPNPVQGWIRRIG